MDTHCFFNGSQSEITQLDIFVVHDQHIRGLEVEVQALVSMQG